MSQAPSTLQRQNITLQFSFTPTITSGSAYASGNQLGGIITLSNVLRQFPTDYPVGIGGGAAELREITILDGAKQDSAIDFYFFNQSPTVTSVDKQAFAMTKTNLQAQCIGAVSVGTSYSDAAAVSVSTDGKNIGQIMYIPGNAANPNNVYAIAICRGTPTFTTTTDLKFLFSFYID